MSVRITDLENVALYDSVTGWAFGPTFPSEEAAESFLAYTEDEPDPRTWSQDRMEMAYQAWILARGQEFGLEIGHPA